MASQQDTESLKEDEKMKVKVSELNLGKPFFIMLILFLVAVVLFINVVWEKDRINSQYDSCILDKSNIGVQYESCITDKNNIGNQYTSCIADKNKIVSEKESIKSQYDSCIVDKNSIKSQYDSCIVDKNSIKSQYDSCIVDKNNAINAIQTEKNSISNQYTVCINELNKIKSSPDYYYSSKMHPNSDTIKSAAANAITLFQNEPDCESYILWMCEKYNYKKRYYYGLKAKDGMEQYYQRAVTANYYWVRNNIQYVLGSGSLSGAQDDYTTLSVKGGKCDEQAVLLASMLRSIGLDARVVILYGINHAVTAVNYPGMVKDVMPGAYIVVEDKPFFIMDTTCSSCEIGTIPPTDVGQQVTLLEFKNVNQ